MTVHLFFYTWRGGPCNITWGSQSTALTKVSLLGRNVELLEHGWICKQANTRILISKIKNSIYKYDTTGIYRKKSRAKLVTISMKT